MGAGFCRGALRLALPLLAMGALAAPGSWQAQAPPLRVAVPGRFHSSAELAPPALAGAPTRIGWRFSSSARPAPDAWLCQRQACVALDTYRGHLPAPATWTAGAPLYFRFRLPAGQDQAVRVTNMQVRVEYGE